MESNFCTWVGTTFLYVRWYLHVAGVGQECLGVEVIMC